LILKLSDQVPTLHLCVLKPILMTHCSSWWSDYLWGLASW